MTSKQILDSFSATLLQDERILSARERALLLSILQQAKSAAYGNAGAQAGVESVIASAVGETVAQRAFGILGGSIVERILDSAPGSVPDVANHNTAVMHENGPGPSPSPDPQPQPPHVKRPPMPPKSQPQPPHRPAKDTPPQPQPQPPHGTLPRHASVVNQEAQVVTLQQPAVSLARCVVLDEFLAPQELEELMQFTLQHEIDFLASEVVSPTSDEGIVNYEHRRSRVLMDVGVHQDVLLQRIKSVLPPVLEKLAIDEFPIVSVEAQITASNDGDFFRNHSDSGDGKVASRCLTFVYFFHHEPRAFEGGELRIHDSRRGGAHEVATGAYQSIVPQQNQIVFFPSSMLHEITPVKCPSGLFADSRFTLNGWLHR